MTGDDRSTDMRRIGLIVLLLGSSSWLLAQGTMPAAPGAASSPQQPPTFRSGVALVQMDVTVLDKNRRPVMGLTAADFTVKEDGVERPIAAFTAVDLSRTSLANASRRPVAPPDAGVAAPGTPATSPREEAPGRLVTILMDRSTPPGEPTIVARHIANAVVDALGPDDQAAVLYTGFGEPQEFTGDRALLHATIARSDPSAVLSEGAQQIMKADPMTTGACYCGLCVPETIAHVAEVVGTMSQRKVLFFVGHDMEFQSSRDDCGFLLRKARDRMVRAIDVANLTVHVLDPSGVLQHALSSSPSDLVGRGASHRR
jgi:VWFA-related protein